MEKNDKQKIGLIAMAIIVASALVAYLVCRDKKTFKMHYQTAREKAKGFFENLKKKDVSG